MDSSTGPPILDAASDALFLDVDGTMIDIAPAPDQVVVQPSLILALERLHAGFGGALALVSGRRIADLDRLFSPLTLAAAGCHGAEIRSRPGGPIVTLPSIGSVLKASLAALSGLSPAIRAEDKACSVALHYRQALDLGPALLSGVRETVAASADKDVRVMAGKAIVEVIRAGADKGTAIRTLMKSPPFAGRRPVFAGDDATDEDALAVLPAMSGLGLFVGRAAPGARYVFASPERVRAWISTLAAQYG